MLHFNKLCRRSRATTVFVIRLHFNCVLDPIIVLLNTGIYSWSVEESTSPSPWHHTYLSGSNSSIHLNLYWIEKFDFFWKVLEATLMFLHSGPPESPKQESMPPRNQLNCLFWCDPRVSLSGNFLGLYQYLVGSVYFDNLFFLAVSLSVVIRVDVKLKFTMFLNAYLTQIVSSFCSSFQRIF